MSNLQLEFGAVRVYEANPTGSGAFTLRLKDRVVELGPRDFNRYKSLVEWLPTTRTAKDFAVEIGLDEPKLERFASTLADAGLLFRRAAIPAKMSGEEFHRDYFSKILPSWLSEGFSHPFWDRMMTGKGSARLYTGWIIELYHYTRNANRHMPLSSAYTHSKPIKSLRAKHYAEEWNHYHYFLKSLRALGYASEQIETSLPLPMTLALSNFMRQAAREDVLAYSVCSAVLEGTTTDRGAYNPYYEKAGELYGIPKAAIAPIFAHLDLDVQYQHSDLFLDILKTVPEITPERASLVLSYGHQLTEHVWLWTENIEKYYDDPSNPMPRVPFDPMLD
jgi:pyrroloquinoline quinone (PQQ) biosynthesis protein C